MSILRKSLKDLYSILRFIDIPFNVLLLLLLSYQLLHCITFDTILHKDLDVLRQEDQGKP